MTQKNARKLGLVGGYNGLNDYPAYDGGLQLAKALADLGIQVICEAEPASPVATLVQEVQAHGGIVMFIKRYLPSMADGAESLQLEKMYFYHLADEFLVLPGGLKTLDKLTEYLTWMQRIHGRKPVALVDEGGFWLPLVALFKNMEAHGFLPMNFRERIQRFSSLNDYTENLKTRQ